MTPPKEGELRELYRRRFAPNLDYRRRVWKVLVAAFFQRFVEPTAVVLDLGCGYGEFINEVRCRRRYGMDLNEDAPRHLSPEVTFLHEDCSAVWPLPDAHLDLVFTSNFFEHLASKEALAATLFQAARCLRPGGRLIAVGPNIRVVPGAYWDFWDHHLPLSERSLAEGLRHRGFRVERCVDRFLPYTMVGAFRYPTVMIRWYLAVPWLWRLFGKQFLVVGVRE